jgi:hypothetical protein
LLYVAKLIIFFFFPLFFLEFFIIANQHVMQKVTKTPLLPGGGAGVVGLTFPAGKDGA